jgi:hypothetical protein
MTRRAPAVGSVRLVFGTLILLSLTVFADAQGPPPSNLVTVLPGDPGWDQFAHPGASVQIGTSNPRAGLGSLEFTSGIQGTPALGTGWHPGKP